MEPIVIVLLAIIGIEALVIMFLYDTNKAAINKEVSDKITSIETSLKSIEGKILSKATSLESEVKASIPSLEKTVVADLPKVESEIKAELPTIQSAIQSEVKKA